jgi:hypothetical protein
MVSRMQVPNNPKFTEPIYTLGEASLYLCLPPRTFWDWARPVGNSHAKTGANGS